MKKNVKTLIALALVSLMIVPSCKKKEEDEPTPAGPSGPSTTYMISKDSAYDGSGAPQMTRKFEYNSSKKLVKVSYKFGTALTYDYYDTVIYSGSQVSNVNSFAAGVGTPSKTQTMTYTSGMLSSVAETGSNSNGPYVRTRSFAYSGGKPTSQTVTYTSGMSDGSPENITSIVFTGNNVSSADLVGMGPVTATASTTAANPYYGLNYDASDFINLFNQNNLLKAYLTAMPTTLLNDYTYTYSNGRVATMTDAVNNTTTIVTYSAY